MNRIRVIILASVFAVLVVIFYREAMAQSEVSALWTRTNENGEVHIRITEENGLFIGTIEWMENPRNDVNNPDTNLQNRSLVGARIFSDMAQDTVNTYKGTLYNPEDGKTYSGTLKIVNATTLTLRGCVIWPLCKTDTWKLVSEPISDKLTDWKN